MIIVLANEVDDNKVLCTLVFTIFVGQDLDVLSRVLAKEKSVRPYYI